MAKSTPRRRRSTPPPARTPTTDSTAVLDTLLGIGRAAVEVHGQRIEFRRRGEMSILERRRLAIRGKELDELRRAVEETEQGDALEERCLHLGRVLRELAALCLVGDVSALTDTDLEDVLNLFFVHAQQQMAARAAEMQSILSTLSPTSPPSTEEEPPPAGEDGSTPH